VPTLQSPIFFRKDIQAAWWRGLPDVLTEFPAGAAISPAVLKDWKSTFVLFFCPVFRRKLIRIKN
jgi:hypothetical protein